jgi:hypothetical protein
MATMNPRRLRGVLRAALGPTVNPADDPGAHRSPLLITPGHRLKRVPHKAHSPILTRDLTQA